MSKFNVGEVVQLKSGGPLMTIQAIGDYSLSNGLNPGVLCVWFDDKKKVEDVFHPEALERYDG
jgi:uncharacterized protein YodC (DUF2158 family)